MCGLGTDMSCRISRVYFFVFFFFFAFLQHAPRSHFLTEWDDLYAKTRVSGHGCAFCGSRQYRTTFRGSSSKKTSPKSARMSQIGEVVK